MNLEGPRSDGISSKKRIETVSTGEIDRRTESEGLLLSRSIEEADSDCLLGHEFRKGRRLDNRRNNPLERAEGEEPSGHAHAVDVVGFKQSFEVRALGP